MRLQRPSRRVKAEAQSARKFRNNRQRHKIPGLSRPFRAHLTVVNSLALVKAKITKETKAPGGVIDRDANGELTGKLREAPARKLITRAMPPVPRPDTETAMAGLRRFLEGLLAVGITTAPLAEVNYHGIPRLAILHQRHHRPAERSHTQSPESPGDVLVLRCRERASLPSAWDARTRLSTKASGEAAASSIERPNTGSML